MKRTIISAAFIALILFCACSRAVSDKTNLTIVNECPEDVSLKTVAVQADGSTECAMNADNAAIAPGDSFTFEISKVADYAFDVAVSDESDRIITLESFNLSFDEGQKYTLYIVKNGTDVSVVSDGSAGN